MQSRRFSIGCEQMALEPQLVVILALVHRAVARRCARGCRELGHSCSSSCDRSDRFDPVTFLVRSSSNASNRSAQKWRKGASQSSISASGAGAQPVAAVLFVDSRGHHLRLAQDAQVLGDGGLAEREASTNSSTLRSPWRQLVQDAAAIRLGEDSEGRPHGDSMPY